MCQKTRKNAPLLPRKRVIKPGNLKKIEIDGITLSSDDDETHKEKFNTPPPILAKIKKEAPEELEAEASRPEASKEHKDVTAELLKNVKIEIPDDPEARAIIGATAKSQK